MLLFPVTAGLAVCVGYLAGGSLRSLTRVRLRAGGLLVVALVLQVTLRLVPPTWQNALLVGSYTLVGLWFLLNARRSRGVRVGIGLLALGYVMNLAAILPNGGMPVSGDALHHLDAPADPDRFAGNIAKHVEDDGARLSVLGDAVPVPSMGAVVSVGDLSMLLGTIVTIATGMRTGAARPADHRTSLMGVAS